jgi:predicted nucleic acid-binding protein
MIYIDANVFIFAALDTTSRGKAARGCLKLVDDGVVEAVTSSLTLDEIMWTLIKSGRKRLIKPVISSIYESKVGVVGVSSQAPLKACDFVDLGLSPRDGIHTAVARENHINEMLSEDKHFDKIKWLKRYSVSSFLKDFRS